MCLDQYNTHYTLVHAQFSHSATLPILIYGPTSRTPFYIPGSPSVLASIEMIREGRLGTRLAGDNAMSKERGPRIPTFPVKMGTPDCSEFSPSYYPLTGYHFLFMHHARAARSHPLIAICVHPLNWMYDRLISDQSSWFF